MRTIIAFLMASSSSVSLRSSASRADLIQPRRLTSRSRNLDSPNSLAVIAIVLAKSFLVIAWSASKVFAPIDVPHPAT